MWSKVYLTALVIGIVVMAGFRYYSWSWLQSIGDPRAAWEAYNYDRRAGVYVLLGMTALFVILGNVVLWMTRSAWALWSSHIFFSVFALVLLFWLHLQGVSFCIENGVCTAPSRMVGPILAIIGIAGVAGVIFVDQLVLLRMHAKMYPPAVDDGVDTEKENSRPAKAES